MRVIELDKINDVTIAMKIRKENVNQIDFGRSEYRTFERFTSSKKETPPMPQLDCIRITEMRLSDNQEYCSRI